MPKRTDIRKVLVVGSGPIVIGQAAEFDYSGSQACRSLREEGIKVILVNSNPATIQTDYEIADTVYIEPLRAEVLEKIIAKEKPDGILGTMAGQTGLNLTMQLYENKTLKRYRVEVLGTGVDAIGAASERGRFAELMKKIGEPVLDSVAANSVDEAVAFAKRQGYPLILRPAYTLGGTGGGIAHDEEELVERMKFGMRFSRIGQVLIEKSVAGWGEFEYEVMRDSKGNCITICNMENFDPMGVHTGESIVVAPSQTLSNNDHQMLRSASLKIINALNIRGGCNIQFALNQKTGEYFVIEVNPRLSRSSALASKATGYPIARVAAKIALGYSLDEIPNAITKKTPASFEPALDYVVVKIPRWPFDKMPEADRHVGTQMKSTGEVMAIGRSFEEALQKAVRSCEIKKRSLSDSSFKSLDACMEHIRNPTDERLFAIYSALKQGISPGRISRASGINKWFLDKMKNICEAEEEIRRAGRSIFKDPALLTRAKGMGFSDRQIAGIVGCEEAEARRGRKALDIKPVYKIVDTCAAEFEASTPYYYSTYEKEDEANPVKVRKVIIIGAGPIRIGQGIEFDYCCCHASFALREEGVQSIMINNNPETVSTDFDASDKLYFEPLTFEDVMNVIEKENPDGVIVQFGGQTSINMAVQLAKAGVNILGTGIWGIDIAEDRKRFRKLLKKLGIPQPRNGTAKSADDALKVAEKIGYPIVVRPSYVIAGRGMRILYDADDFRRYIHEAVDVSERKPVLIERYVENAIECEVDGVSDRKRLFIGGMMEHIERAGVHSGDASCVTPPVRLSKPLQRKIVSYSRRISTALKNIGAINIQFAVQGNKVFVLEANPRASRTVPYLSKATGIPLAKIATKITLGHELDEYGLKETPRLPYFAVKSVAFPFLKLPGTDFVLGPEMKSTGESMGIDTDFENAYYKALLGANLEIGKKGNVAISLNEEDKTLANELAIRFSSLGFKILASEGTAKSIGDGIRVKVLSKTSDSEPNIRKRILDGDVCLVINTPGHINGEISESSKIRRAAIEAGVPCITNIEAAFCIADAIGHVRKKGTRTESLESYTNSLKRVWNG
jgi:carbamoyl-phosphate synthase large subunit